ncbi:MAG: phosphatase PAP2 family protein [Pseudonocardiaceae bacterium]|nr:phosphatase PAP2 family protein [Pseudonocardiaceae bacterium]
MTVTLREPPALPPALRRPIGTTAALAAVVVVVLAVRYSGDVAASSLDNWARGAVDRLLPQPGPAALLVDVVGAPLVTLALVGLLAAVCLALGRRRLAVVAVASVVLTGAATTLLKPVIGRTIHGGYLSYPSGHTAAATLLALVVALLAVDLLRVGGLPGVLVIVAAAGAAGATMAWSQVALGAHYPTDTIGGFGTAMAVVPATALAIDRLAGRRRGPRRSPPVGDPYHGDVVGAVEAGRPVPSHRCRGCDSVDVVQVVDLGSQPGADYFPPVSTPGDDPRWPLELWLCRRCTLVQLGPVEPQLPEPPLAIESATSLAHAETSVRDLVRDHPDLAGATVVEFDSHHGGSWLPHLLAAGCRPVADGERAHLVVDVHGLAHEPAIGRSLAQRVERLAPGGLLVLEFHHLLPLLVENQFDTVRHGHWSYLSLGALSRLAAPLGLAVAAVRPVSLFGGSLRVMLRHTGANGLEADGSVTAVLDDEAAAGVADPERLAGLHAAAQRSAGTLHDYLVAQRVDGRTVLGYGAPSKAPVLLDVSRVGPDLLPFTVDAAPGKHGRRIPGAAVPIRPVDDLRAARPDVVLVLTWDIVDEVISVLEADGGWGAEYLVPMPEPHLVTPSVGAVQSP